MVSKALQVVKHELRQAVFPTIFFFVVFVLMIFTKALVLDSYNIHWVNSGSAALSAMIVAKAILIIDMTSAGRMFRDTRLVYHILWRTVIYSLLVSAFRYVEELIPLWSEYGSFGEASQHMLIEISWQHFVVTQLWLFVSILTFSTIVTLDEYFGPESIKKALFGLTTKNSQRAG